MAKNEHNALYILGVGQGDGSSTLPIQTLSKNQKTSKWKHYNMDCLERIGIRQLHHNVKFRQFYKMIQGEFTYGAVGLEEFDMPYFEKELGKLKTDYTVPSFIKHFDFIGIIVRVLEGLYSEFEDRFIIDSKDEYSTNEFIRQKTEMLHQYAQQVFSQEITKLLVMKGLDPNKQDFETQEEAQAYQQTLQQEAQALTPPEIERFMAKNFKVLAVEWAQNTIVEDNSEFKIPKMDRENFVDYLLSGRYFKHFGVGYDNYYVERWRVEETFFSQDSDARYPQEGEFVGRITYMSPSNILNKFGHLMTTKEQETIGNYWNQNKDYEWSNGARIETTTDKPIEETAFAQPTVVPFHNYYDHQANVQLEDALGVPMAKRTIQGADGEDIVFDSWIPRLDEPEDFRGDLYSAHLRDDIQVRRDTVRVTEAYWRSYKKLGILIYENDLGTTSVEVVTDDLLSDFLKEKEIKKLRNISVEELQKALKLDRLSEYVNTITYMYAPEVWKGIKIRGNGRTVRNDIYLDVKPLEYQIKGSRSNIYNVLLPVAGIIDTGIVTRLLPYQQLHNIAMNQITEMLEKELGQFFTFDITALTEEYKDQTTEQAVYQVRDIIKDTGLLPLDASRQNTQGNQTPANLFQRQEISYANFVQYRMQLAQQYKQDALAQIGITPQMLGAPNTYTTAEGVKQGAQASYALINPIFEAMTDAKGREMELHIAVAQYAQSNGKDATVLFRKGDGELRFLDIMKEDGELFPLRHLGVTAVSSAKDKKIIEQFRQFVMNDNTITKDLETSLDILTNPSITELRDVVKEATKKSQEQIQQQRQFEAEQVDKQIQSVEQQQNKLFQHQAFIEDMKITGKLKEAQIQSYGRLQDNENVDAQLLDRIEKVTQNNVNNEFRNEEISVKNRDIDRKELNDTELRNIEIQKLAQKAEELRIKRDKVNADKYIATINKN